MDNSIAAVFFFHCKFIHKICEMIEINLITSQEVIAIILKVNLQDR